MLALFADKIDFDNLSLDDPATYELFQRADTDGIHMMESDWDKYDLLQIKPKNFDELTATIAMSHGLAINPYIYTYIKIEKIKPFTYPRFTEIPKVKEILSVTHGLLLWKEQKEEILDCIDSLSEEEKENYKPEFGISDSRFPCYASFPTDVYYIYPPNNMDGQMQNCKVQIKFTFIAVL